MTDCRMCKNKQNCVFAYERIQKLNDYDNGIIERDDNGNQIDCYKQYNGCEDYQEL